MPAENAVTGITDVKIDPQTIATSEPEPQLPSMGNPAQMARELGIPEAEIERIQSEITPPEPEPAPQAAAPEAEQPEEEAEEKPNAEAEPAEEPSEETVAGEAESDAEEQNDESKSQETRDKQQKRIDRVTRKWRESERRELELEEKLAQTEAELESRQPITVTPTVDNPLAHVTDLKGLQAEKAIAKNAVDFLRTKLNGYVTTEGKEIEPEEVSRNLRYFEDVLTESVPAREKFLQEQPQFTRQAKQILPSMFDLGHVDHQASRVILKENPWLVNDPQRDLKVAVSLIGWKQVLAAAQTPQGKNGKTDPKLEIPEQILTQHAQRSQTPLQRQTPPGRPGGGVVPVKGKSMEEAWKEVEQTGGSDEAIQRAVAASLRQERSQRNGKTATLV